MCGIIGYTGKNKAIPYLVKGLESMEYRGYDSAGICTLEGNAFRRIRKSGRVESLKTALMGSSYGGTAGIGHTRWATHGEPSETNAHPHIGYKGIFSLVHNGIIENYSELRSSLEKEGVAFFTDTDTEVIPNLMEKYYEGDPLSAIISACKSLEGAYALAVLCRDFPDKLFCVKKGSPLLVANSPEGSFAASDISALSPHCERAYRLQEDELAVISSESLEIFSGKGKKIEVEFFPVSITGDDEKKGNFPHFMLKEIYEQPQAFETTLKSYIKAGRVNLPFSLPKTESIDIVACGSAYNAGLVGKYVIEELSGIPAEVHLAGEYRYKKATRKKNSLVILISQSGETADTLAALRKAKSEGNITLAVVNVPLSSIACEAELTLHTRAGREVAVATTKAYLCQLCVMYLLALSFGRAGGTLTREEEKTFLNELLSIPEKIKEVLTLSKQIELLASEIAAKNHIFFIGRNTDFALSLEAALKLKEISYIPSEGYSAAELKHGTISLIEKDTSVIALALRRDVLKKTLSNIREVKARGGEVIVIASKETEGELEGERCILLPCTEDIFSSSIGAVAVQLLGYHTARERGCDIDKPRNLAKSVTVE